MVSWELEDFWAFTFLVNEIKIKIKICDLRIIFLSGSIDEYCKYVSKRVESYSCENKMPLAWS